jgi:hypothetical protein
MAIRFYAHVYDFDQTVRIKSHGEDDKKSRFPCD